MKTCILAPILLIVLVCLGLSTASARTMVTVTDASNGSPLASATVFTASGSILGLTDSDGRIAAAQGDFPLTVNYMGFHTATAVRGDSAVALEPKSYELSDVVVTPGSRPVLRITFYVREYASGVTPTDTVVIFNEHMADVFVPTQPKVKGFKKQTHPRFLSSRLRTRKANSQGLDSVFTPAQRNDDLCFPFLMDIPYFVSPLPDTIAGGAAEYTIDGKAGPLVTFRRQGDAIHINKDLLADTKDHKFSPAILKLLGMTADFTDISSSSAYRIAPDSTFSTKGVMFQSYAIRLTGRGKFFKKYFDTHGKPIEIYNYYELYPVDFEYLSAAEAKELQKNPPSPPVVSSPEAAPVSGMFARMLEPNR